MFDPHATLAALDRHGVSYVVIGAFARVIQGTEEITRGIDVVPSLRGENLRRLTLAVEELGAYRSDGQALVLDEATIHDQPVIRLDGPAGELKIVPRPAGTRGGYDDLRRAATGGGLQHALQAPSWSVVGNQLEREIETTGAHDFDQRLDAGGDSTLFPTCDHRAAAAAARGQLVLAQAGAQAGFADEVAASHRADSRLVDYGY